MEIRILLFDLDGTLLRSDKTISPRTLFAIEQCRANGSLVGIVTSRSEMNSAQFIDQLKPDVVISSGGALVRVYSANASKIILCEEFSENETAAFISTAQKIVGANCKITVDTITEHFRNCYPLGFPGGEELEKSWGKSIQTDFAGFQKPSLKICVEIHDSKTAKKLAENFPDCDMIRFSDGDWYKFTKKSATKENAIRHLLEHFKLDAKSLVAFGDDFADIGMLKLAGVGIAMGNAIPEVKQAADIVIGTNDANSIADWLEKEWLQ